MPLSLCHLGEPPPSMDILSQAPVPESPGNTTSVPSRGMTPCFTNNTPCYSPRSREIIKMVTLAVTIFIHGVLAIIPSIVISKATINNSLIILSYKTGHI